MNHELFMRRCFDLARKGAGKAAPNPLVGAVLVYNNRIIGEGYHAYYGGPHAEVNCINSVAEQDQELIAQSCLYVNLEPCAHFGKTPPCAHLVVASGIKQVVICNKDPFEQVNGNGIDYLKQHGIEVRCGILEHEGLQLNKVFFTNIIKKRPYIYLKWAATSDGFVGNSKQRISISNRLHKLWMQHVRSQIPSILVGRNTVSVDNPLLTSSYATAQQATRLVIDPLLKLDLQASVFNKESNTIIFNYLKNEKREHLEWVRLTKEQPIPNQIVEYLHTQQISAVLIEGGPFTLNEFIKNDLWDEAIVCVSNAILNEGIKAPILKNEICKSAFTLKDNNIAIFKHQDNLFI
jgi:diaminohydroxyphosphoribosylaminopyrimidine deaminase/5-amino-6-(5-phosphoribosylamino)uracil reductase